MYGVLTQDTVGFDMKERQLEIEERELRIEHERLELQKLKWKLSIKLLLF